MTKGSVVFTRLAIGSVAVGTLAIIVGNSQIAMGDSHQLRFIGDTVRYVGLCICTMTAIVFLLVRMEAHRRQRAQRPQPTSLPLGLTNATGPSQMLVTWIRVFCVTLFVLAIFCVFLFVLAIFNLAWSSPVVRSSTWYLVSTDTVACQQATCFTCCSMQQFY